MTATIHKLILVATLGVTALFASSTAAQTPAAAGEVGDATRQAFQRARMAAEVEQDLPKAIAILTDLTEKAPTGAAKARAWLLLSDAHRGLGQVELADAALAKAAEGDGEAAAEAKSRLERREDVADQASVLLYKLRLEESEENVDRLENQLTWLGDSVIPFVISNLEGEQRDLRFVTRASELLYRLKGPEVSDWLARVAGEYPVLVQRAVIRGIQGTGPGDVLAEGLSRFTESNDPVVLTDALQQYPTLFTKEQIIGWVTHEHPSLRERALRTLGSWHSMRGEDSVDVRRSLFDALRGVSELDAAGIARRLPSTFESPSSADELRLYMDFLRAGFPLSLKRLETPVDPDSLVEFARDLETAAGFVPKGARKLAANALFGWTRSAVPQVVDLVKTGILEPPFAVGFAKTHAKGDDWTQFFRVLPTLRAGDWMLQSEDAENAALPASAFEPLRDYVEKHIVPNPSVELHYALGAIARIPTQEATEWLGEFLATDRFWNARLIEVLRESHGRIFEFIVQTYRRDEFWVDALLRWVAESCGGESTRNVRTKVLLNLLFDRFDERAVERAAEAFATGAEVSDLFYRLRNDLDEFDADSRATVTGLVDVMASARPESLWGLSFRNWLEDNATYSECPRWLQAKLIQRLDTVSEAKRKNAIFWLTRDAAVPGASELVMRSLTDQDESVRAYAVRVIRHHFDDAERTPLYRRALGDEAGSVRLAAVGQTVATKDTRLVPELITLTRHRDNRTRAQSFDAIAHLDPESAFEVAMNLVEDPSRSVRTHICEFAKATVDRRFAPVLVEYLRDPDLNKHAQEALDAIRYYHEEKSRWSRIASGTDLSETSAAEALVGQATQTDDRDVRLLAIRSLGTLGVAETLPILIRMVKDDDSEIATAAREAVLAIQAAGSKK